MNTRRIPANTKRMVEGAIVDAKRNAELAVRSSGNTWAATVYKGDSKPKECATCNKRGVHMQMINVGEIECSHIECPNRKRCTAQPSADVPGVDE